MGTSLAMVETVVSVASCKMYDNSAISSPAKKEMLNRVVVAFLVVTERSRIGAHSLYRERRGREPALSETKETDLIAFVPAVTFLLPFSSAKSHVKPLNHLTASNKRKSSWHFS